jgi:hypothetical protein
MRALWVVDGNVLNPRSAPWVRRFRAGDAVMCGDDRIRADIRGGGFVEVRETCECVCVELMMFL